MPEPGRNLDCPLEAQRSLRRCAYLSHGDAAPAAADDEVVLIGRQGDDEITATEWAERLGTISYEIVTGIGARVPRSYSGAADAGAGS